MTLPTVSSIVSHSQSQSDDGDMQRCEEIRVVESSTSTMTTSSSRRSFRPMDLHNKFGLKWNKNWKLRKEP